MPPWADDLDGSRKVVMVTQGTVSNHDFSELVVPTLAALADEPDVLVVVTAGGRSSTTIPGPIPDNARLADYLPLDWLLPKVDAIVTNGGYGTVNQALSHGIPSSRRRGVGGQTRRQRPGGMVRGRHRPPNQCTSPRSTARGGASGLG